ncbi:33615_t:CDS:2 [Gigaspora margarita]|uniref:33615_t:CDS:1 n=1 Tax=Gigaspora margarita TaxID=4874 RepID=A0ABM8W4W9_GIGMA|nr:33615_t:CDS:2 [Gigaspora margarita]
MRIYLISFILLSVISKIYCFLDGHPEGRGGQESVQVNDRIYYMGGSRLIRSLKRYNLSDEVFYLDLSSLFNTANPPFTDLTDGKMLYGNEKGIAVLGGSSRSDIYLVGGTQVNLSTINWNVTNQTINWNVTDQFIYIYKTVPNTWTKLQQGVKGTQPSRRRSTSTVIKPNGTIYIFGGRVEQDMGSSTLMLYNDLYEFDTIQLSWKQITASYAPSPRSHSTATLLPNGKIIYIGGVSQDAVGSQTNLIIMTEIQIFDTNSLSWSTRTASSSSLIQPRVGHTAVLTSDNNSIIVMGGTSSYQLSQTTVYPNLMKLDISSEPYQYSELKPSGINPPPPLSYHSANIYSDYMIIAFGNITNDVTDSTETNSKVYLLYVPCLTWESTFNPGRSDCKNNQKPPNPPNLNIIIGCSIAVVVVITGIILCVKFRRNIFECFDSDHGNNGSIDTIDRDLPNEQPT